MLRSQRARGAVLAGVVVAITTGLVGCRKSSAASHDVEVAADGSSPRVDGSVLILKPNDPQIVALSTALAVPAAAESVSVPGRLTWDEDVTVRVFSPFAGRVARVTADIGKRVRPEQTLALIASPDFGQAQADARRSATDLALDERNAARTRDLLDHGVAAQKDLEAAEAEVARARAEYQRTQTRLALYGAHDASTIDQVFALRAPIGGVVVERSVTPGQEVRPDQMLASAPQLFAPLFVVTDPTRLWVVMDLPERDLPLVTPGSVIETRVNAWPDRVFPGRVTLVSGSVDPSTRTVKARGALLNTQGLLKAEMLVTVSLAAPARGAVAVPSAAVLLQGNDHVVFVDEGKGRLRRTPVTIGAERRGIVPVLSGLAPGERIVTNGSLLFEQLFQQTKSHS